MDRATWLKARQQGVGSSDSPNLVGVGFRTAADVYREKLSPVDATPPTTGVLARGIALEQIVADRYAREMDEELFPADPLYVHPDRPWQLATPDRVRRDARFVELKTCVGFGDEWGPAGSDRVPDGYRVQVTHQMGVVGAESIDLAALDVIGWEIRIFRIAFDQQLFDWLTDVEAEFWHKHVMPRLPPSPEWESRFTPQAEARLIRPGTRVDLGEWGAGVAAAIQSFREIEREAKERASEFLKQLNAAVADAQEAVAGDWAIRWVQRKAHTVQAHDVAASSYLSIKPRKGSR